MHRGRTDGCRFFSGWTALHHPGIQLGPSRIEQVFTVCLCKRLIASHKAAEFIVHDRVQMVQYDQARTVREPSGLRLRTSTLSCGVLVCNRRSIKGVPKINRILMQIGATPLVLGLGIWKKIELLEGLGVEKKTQTPSLWCCLSINVGTLALE